MARSIVANSALNAVAGLALLVTGFACSVIAARLLGPEASGIIAFSLWIAVTGALVAELGTGVLLLRILPQLKLQGHPPESRRGFAAYLLRPVVVATLVLLALYILAFHEAETHHWSATAPSVVLITGILLLVQSIGSFSKNYLIGEQRLEDFLKLVVIASVLQLGAVFLGAFYFGVEGALAGYVFGQVVLFVYSIGILGAKANSGGFTVRYLAGSSLLLSAEYIVSSVFLNRVELVFLQQFHGVELVGFYAISLSLANLALQLPVQLTGSLLPYYSEQLQKQDSGKLPVSVFEGVVRSLSYITLPISFGLAAISHELVVAIFGREFSPAGNIVALLALSVPVFVFSQVCTQYLFSLDRIRERLFIGVAGAVVMVGSAFALVPSLGGEGAAVARFLTFLTMCVLMVRYMAFEGSMRPMFGSLAKIGFAASLCGFAAFAVTRTLPGAIGIVAAIATGAAVYAAALRLLRAVPDQDARILQALAAKLPARLQPVANRILRPIVPQRTSE